MGGVNLKCAGGKGECFLKGYVYGYGCSPQGSSRLCDALCVLVSEVLI